MKRRRNLFLVVLILILSYWFYCLETNSRGPIQQVPGQSVITRFFGTADQVRTTVFPVVATATTASSTQVAPATTKAKTPKEKPEKAVTAPSAVPENQAAYGELKRQADSLRIGKEQAELRVRIMRLLCSFAPVNL